MSTPERAELFAGSEVVSDKASYRVVKFLGEGGFGAVYQVENPTGQFALKLTQMWKLLPADRVEYAKRFRQEYEYGSKIRSPFIIRSYDFGVHKGNPFLVMELCAGGSLGDLIGKPQSAADLSTLATGILLGLKALHTEGIIHRDIKPENILFDDKGTPRLADFGVSASVKKRQTIANFQGHAKIVFATYTYAPPEQYDQKRAMKVMGPANDIYAFGVVMYELITRGSLPFGSLGEQGNDLHAYLARKAAGKWDQEKLRIAAPDPKWIRIIDCCLKTDPKERYRSVGEILLLLGSVIPVDEPAASETYASHWVLRVQNGEEIGREYNLTNLAANLSTRVLTLGWFDPQNPFQNDIGIQEHFTKYVSRYHATLAKDYKENTWYIKDGQYVNISGVQVWKPSTNGILSDGRRIDEHGEKLRPGLIITIGDTTLKVINRQE